MRFRFNHLFQLINILLRSNPFNLWKPRFFFSRCRTFIFFNFKIHSCQHQESVQRANYASNQSLFCLKMCSTYATWKNLFSASVLIFFLSLFIFWQPTEYLSCEWFWSYSREKFVWRTNVCGSKNLKNFRFIKILRTIYLVDKKKIFPCKYSVCLIG